MLDSRKDQIQLLFGLKAKLEGDNEGIADASKDETLSKRVCYLFPIDDMGFSDSFQSIYPHSITLPDLHDLER